MPLYSFLAGNGMAHPVEAPGVQRAKRKLWEQPNGNMDMVEMEGVTVSNLHKLSNLQCIHNCFLPSAV